MGQEHHPYTPHVSFDGGDLDCGNGLLLLIRKHIDPLAPGQLLEIRSTESSVREDLPAWCRLTGNGLVSHVQDGRDGARYDKLGLTDPDFIRNDTSRDGFLSRSELAGDAVLIRNFARFDSNKDGRLSEAEYRNAEIRLEQERAAVAVDHAELAATVRKALAAVKGIDSEYVKIEVAAGAVVMTGIAGHAGLAIQAQDAVKRVPGVKSIRNRLVSGDQIGWD